MNKKESVKLDLLGEGKLSRQRSSGSSSSGSSGQGKEKLYLILGFSAIAFVAMVCGLIIAFHNFHDANEDAPAFSQVSASSSSLCGVVIANGSSPVVCFNQHTKVPSGDFIMVSHSTTHACAISTDNGVICWGRGCDKGSEGCPAHLQTESDTPYTLVEVGDFTTCLLHQSNFTAECFGRFPVPTTLAATEFVDLVIHGTLACGITAESQTLCWDTQGQVLTVPTLSDGTLEAAGSYVIPAPSASNSDGLDESMSSEGSTRRRRGVEPVPIEVPDDAAPTLCAVSFIGEAWCSQLEYTAALNATNSTLPAPTWHRVLENSTSTFEAIAFRAGRGCVLTTDSAIECFTATEHVEPFPPVPAGFALLNFTNVIVTENAACGLSSTYQFYCFGDAYTLGAVKLPKPPANDTASASASSSTSSGTASGANGTSSSSSSSSQSSTIAPALLLVPARERCPAGTRRLPDGSCADVDECRAGTHVCPRWSYCVNTYGSAECPCFPGYEKSPSGDHTCVDIDECALGTHNCHADARCTNWNGRFWCTCNPGYEGDGLSCVDVDECARDLHNCDPNASCSNTIGSFNCTCNTGYGGNGTHCSDLDECALGTDACHALADCTNTVGWYNCTCTPNNYGNGTFCDPDQCHFGTDACDVNAYCTDTVPGYNCTCNEGYEGDGFTCNDVNECDLGTHNCHPNATCTNTVGSFDCTCNTHWLGNGTYCDLDECAAGVDNCHEQATCNNTDPGFFCTCNPGWNGTGVECSDVNECDLGTYTCRANSYCNNTIGSYICPCSDYYEEIGVNCVDIDECARSLDHCPDVGCTNEDGYFSCDCTTTSHDFATPADLDSFVGLTRASGLPIFVAVGHNASGYAVEILYCDDHDCQSPTVFMVPELYDETPDAAIRSDDVVVLAGRRVNSQVLLYRWCVDVGCTTTGTRQVEEAGYGTGIAVDGDDNVVIMTSSQTQLKVMHCYSYECAWADREVNATNKIQSNYLDMGVTSGGLPIVSHLEQQYLGVFTCTDDYCTDFTSSDYTKTDDGFMNAMTVRSDGRPVVVWRDQDSGKLRIGLCTTPACDTLDTKDLTNGGFFPTVDLRPYDWLNPGEFPVITHLRSVTGDRTVELITCQDVDCDTIQRQTIQSNGNGGAVGVFYNPVSRYLYTMDEYGDLQDGWRLTKHCIDH